MDIPDERQKATNKTLSTLELTDEQYRGLLAVLEKDPGEAMEVLKANKFQFSLFSTTRNLFDTDPNNLVRQILAWALASFAWSFSDSRLPWTFFVPNYVSLGYVLGKAAFTVYARAKL